MIESISASKSSLCSKTALGKSDKPNSFWKYMIALMVNSVFIVLVCKSCKAEIKDIAGPLESDEERAKNLQSSSKLFWMKLKFIGL